MRPKANRRHGRWLKYLFLAVIVLAIGVVAALFAGFDRLAGPRIAPPPDAQGPTVAIGGVHQTATRDGRPEWRLDADAVRYLTAENKAVFENVTMEFYRPDKPAIQLTARQGVLDSETRDIRISGDVALSGDGIRLETDRLGYHHAGRSFSTDSGVRIEGRGMTLSADTAIYDMETGRTAFSGNVRGSIHDTLKL